MKLSPEKTESLSYLFDETDWICTHVHWLPGAVRNNWDFISVKLPLNMEVVQTIYGLDIIDSDSYESEESFSRLIAESLVMY